MIDLFDGERCKFSREALIIMAAAGLHNYGGSDEAMQMMIGMVFKAFFNDIGFKYNHEQLSKAIPSRRTIRRYEHLLATDW